jgi:Flp pilus assembly pilin Flp
LPGMAYQIEVSTGSLRRVTGGTGTQRNPRKRTRGGPRKGGNMMTSLMKKLVADDAGQDLAEYGIALAVIGVIAAAAAIVIAKDVGSLWSRAQSVIDSAATAS